METTTGTTQHEHDEEPEEIETAPDPATDCMVEIDGEAFGPDDFEHGDFSAGPNLHTVENGRREWILARDSDDAGKAARERWEDMAKHDRREFACIIGEERLVQWALGESDSFGISSLEEFLDVTEQHPEEELAGYDGSEIDDAKVSVALAEEWGWSIPDEATNTGWVDCVAYRCN